MDKKTEINLIAQEERVTNLEKNLASVDRDSNENTNRIDKLKQKTQKINDDLSALGYSLKTGQKPKTSIDNQEVKIEEKKTYEEITQENIEYLKSRGLTDRTFDELFTPEQLLRIERELSEPLKREKWDKWDFIAVLSGGIAGTIADLLIEQRTDAMMNKLAKNPTLKKWANQTKGLSIDYQGPGFGGPYHEGLSSGHDILRLFKAIWQIKNGTFVGIKQTSTGFEWVKSTTNQYGNPYESHGLLESIILWFKHIASDAANPTGIPFPGMSFLTEMPDHEVRKFAIQLYTNGFTLQYIISQALSPALVELIVRGYIFGREYYETKEIKWPTAKRLKTTEMLLASHAIVTAINVGKVIVNCNVEGPLAIRKLNFPSVIMTVRYFIPFVVKRLKLNDPVEIIKRNSREIMEDYDSIILEMSDSIKKDDEYRRFIENGKPIIV